MEGLNLGLAVRMSDFASVNAHKISSSIDKLLKLADGFPNTANRMGSASERLSPALGHVDPSARRAAGGISALSHTINRATPNLVDFRAGIIRLFPYISVAAGVYAIKRGIDNVVQTAREFKASLANLQAAAGYSGRETKWLEGQLRSLAKTSVFSAKEIADSAYDLGTTIEIPVQKLPKLQQAVLNYASATQYSVKESGLDMLSLLVKMKRPLDDATQLFDKMAYATNITSLTAGRLSEMLKITGTEAIEMKVPFEQLLAVLGATDLQYKGGEGGTRLRMLFQSLAQDTKMHEKILQKYGLTMRDVDVKSQGLVNVLTKLRGMNYGDATKLVGGYSAGLLISLTNDTEKILALQKKIEENAAGTGDRMKAIQLASIDGQMKLGQQIRNELKLTVNDSMETPFARVYGKINQFLVFVTDKLRQNRGVLDVLFKGIGNVIDVIGGRIAGWIKGIMQWMGLMGDSSRETQRHIKNNLIPFVVWLEVMAIRTMNFLGGFKNGFLDAASVAVDVVSFIATPLLWLFDIVMPKGADASYKFGYALGILAFGFIALSMAAKVATVWTAVFGEVGLVSMIGNVGRATWALAGSTGLLNALGLSNVAFGTAAAAVGYYGLVLLSLWGAVELGKYTYQHWGEWMDDLGDKWNNLIIDFLKGARIWATISDAIVGTKFSPMVDGWVQSAEETQARREAHKKGMSNIEFAAKLDNAKAGKRSILEIVRRDPNQEVQLHRVGDWTGYTPPVAPKPIPMGPVRPDYQEPAVASPKPALKAYGPEPVTSEPVPMDGVLKFTGVQLAPKIYVFSNPRVTMAPIVNVKPADVQTFPVVNVTNKGEAGRAVVAPSPAAISSIQQPPVSKNYAPDKTAQSSQLRSPAVVSPYTSDSLDSLRTQLNGVVSKAKEAGAFSFGDVHVYGVDGKDPKAMADEFMAQVEKRMRERSKR